MATANNILLMVWWGVILMQFDVGKLGNWVTVVGFMIGICSTVLQIYLNWRLTRLEQKISEKMELKITQAIRDIEREMASSDDLDKFEKSMADKLKIAKYEIIDEIRKMKNGN